MVAWYHGLSQFDWYHWIQLFTGLARQFLLSSLEYIQFADTHPHLAVHTQCLPPFPTGTHGYRRTPQTSTRPPTTYHHWQWTAMGIPSHSQQQIQPTCLRGSPLPCRLEGLWKQCRTHYLETLQEPRKFTTCPSRLPHTVPNKAQVHTLLWLARCYMHSQNFWNPAFGPLASQKKSSQTYIY